MSQGVNKGVIEKQYENANNLNCRISIHDKYSVNKIGFNNWIFSNYRIEAGMKILELGCGTGAMWMNRTDEIEACDKLVLSDFSQGMLLTTQEKLKGYDSIEYKVIDIQNIPYDADEFDIVIANMMLYHVPDLDKGLNEVRRVLKKGGTFYCATYGIHGTMEYLAQTLSEFGVNDDAISKNFTLQNGAEVLERKFDSVIKLEYKDALEVTNVDDMVDYIYSLASMSTLSQVPKEQIRNKLLENMKDGVLHVPKEYGMFLSRK